MEFRSFERCDLDGVIHLCKAEGWESYYNPDRTFRALNAAGVVTVVAVENDRVLGFAQVLTDGAIRAYLANMAVASEQRGKGIGRQLIREAIVRLDAVYLDLLSTGDANGFYERFEHRTLPGYRLFWPKEVSPKK
jgi:ribosomal protein S18 acetylase RimI-like enzyme